MPKISDSAPTSAVVRIPPPRPVKAIDPGAGELEPAAGVPAVVPEVDGVVTEPVVTAAVRIRWR